VSDPPVSDSVSLESLVAEVADEFVARRKRGERPAVAEYARRYPQFAAVLCQVLQSLELVQLSSGSGPEVADLPAHEPEPGLLGDFRILREVGRGGMGVVYEARQLSLDRRVALKVLPFAAALDARQLQRFKNEALAAAQLHHANIVPVFGVGCERGVHFYAMQFIEGRTLAEVIGELRSASAGGTPAGALAPSGPDGVPLPSTLVLAGLSTERSTRTQEFFRTVARLGVQAAEALEYAHKEGIIHRDVKPANLLVDARGNLWITDFGLARLRNETGLTRSGDLVGTLRYMSPEQALGCPASVDHRTDVYALGATLYELLALHPVFEGRDRQELLRRIASEEPYSPRRLNPAVPMELETIVQKALQKEAQARYATALELADDLRRFLEDRPIRARRPSWLEQARKWARRHRPVVVSAAVAVLVSLAALAGALGWVVRDRAARQARIATEVQAALEEARRFQKEGKWPQGQAAAEHAEALLASVGGSEELQRSAGELLADLRMLARLEEVRILGTSVKGGRYDFAAEERGYAAAFRDYGIDVEVLDAREAAQRIGARSIRVELAAALDGWAQKQRWVPHKGSKSWQELLSLARAADPDPGRAALRDAVLRGDRKVLAELAASAQADALPPVTVVELAQYLCEMGGMEEATALLRRTQQRHPEDFWINHVLAHYLVHRDSPHWVEALPFYTAAVALRPDSAKARVNLGEALAATGQLEAALAAFREGLERKGDYVQAHGSIGNALWQMGRHDEAVAAWRRASAHEPPDSCAPCNLGVALYRKGRLDEAAAAFRQAILLRPAFAPAHYNLGLALQHQGRLDEAIASYRRAIDLGADYAEAHCNLGSVLRQQGELVRALAAYRQGHELGSRRPGWPYPSAQWVEDCQRLIELERRLPAVLRREVQPADAAERVAYAQLCSYKKLHAAAARLWEEAFTADPKQDDLEGRWRYAAACAAALAGAGRGADAGAVTEAERARWRRQAVQWLWADLRACSRLVSGGKPEDCRQVRGRLRHWLDDPDLAGLRESAALARLPAGEQQACRQLWTEVQALLAQAEAARVRDRLSNHAKEQSSDARSRP
jgi:serine/threonine protein kinase/Flp pilus assembly protein TadD